MNVHWANIQSDKKNNFPVIELPHYYIEGNMGKFEQRSIKGKESHVELAAVPNFHNQPGVILLDLN